MFEPIKTAVVYIYQPFISPNVISKNLCRIGPDIDPLKRTSRWLAESVAGYSFGNTGLYHIEISNTSYKPLDCSLETNNGYISIWMPVNKYRNPKLIIEKFFIDKIIDMIKNRDESWNEQTKLENIVERMIFVKII